MKPGRPSKFGGVLRVRLSARSRSLLIMHTKGQPYENANGHPIIAQLEPHYGTMTAMVEHGLILASRKDLIPHLSDDPVYRNSRVKIARILDNAATNIRVSLACFYHRYGRIPSRWSREAINQKKLINSLIWFSGRLQLAVNDDQLALDKVRGQLRALACEERNFKKNARRI